MAEQTTPSRTVALGEEHVLVQHHSEPLSTSTGSLDSGSSEKENSDAVPKISAQRSASSSSRKTDNGGDNSVAHTAPNWNERQRQSSRPSFDLDADATSATRSAFIQMESDPNSTVQATVDDDSAPIANTPLQAQVEHITGSSSNEEDGNGEIMERFPPESEISIDPPGCNDDSGGAVDAGIEDEIAHEQQIDLDEGVIVEVEIEEEDLDTLAREMEPEAVQAVLENNGVEEVRFDISSATVSGLTEFEESLSSSSIEKSPPPPMPMQSALTDRFHSDSTDMTNRELVALPERTDFKCQTREDILRATPSPVRSNSAAAAISGSGQSASQIPVVAAVLVPEEPEGTHSNLEASLVPDSGGQGGSSVRGSDSPTWVGPEETKRERNFWITAIAIALCLNSVLVGGIVIAGFCLAGKCRSAPSSNHASTIVFPPTASPLGEGRMSFTISPAAAPGPDAFPSMASTPNFTIGTLVSPASSPPTLSPYPTWPMTDNIQMGTITTLVPPRSSPAEPALSPESAPTLSGTLETPPPAEAEIDASDFGGPLDFPSDSTTDTFVDTEDDAWDDESGEIPYFPLFAVAAIAEFFICGGLCLYYRRVRRKRTDALQSAEPGPGHELEGSSSPEDLI